MAIKKLTNEDVNRVITKITGKENADDGINAIANDLNSGDPVSEGFAKEHAKAIVTTLTPLLFRQYIEDLPDVTRMEKFVRQFFFDTVREGNGVQDIEPIMTGIKNGTTPINLSKFTVDGQVPIKQEVFNINLFTSGSTPSNQTFAPEAFCFEKEITIPETQYLEVFKEGNPEKLFNNLKQSIFNVFTLYMYDKCCKMLTESFSPHKTVNGDGTNAFECWSQDINNLILDMRNFNNFYNYENTSVLHEPESLKIICSQKTYSTLNSSLMSQLFNSANFDVNGMFGRENFWLLGNKINVPVDQSQAITVATDQYINDNTVIIVEPTILKWIQQYSNLSSTYFSTNFTIYYHHYTVLAMKHNPWAKAVKYTNANLNTQPDGAN